MAKRELPSLEKLAEEAFAAAEFHQGRGFISDALDVMGTPERLFEVVRGHLWHTEEAAKNIKAFLRKYDEMYPRR
jgi:hypothetical protein